MPAAPIDIYGRYALQWGGSFAADSAIVSFAGGNLATGAGGTFTENEYRYGPFQAGMLTQTITYSYKQTITRLYEIGSAYAYYVAGRPEGNGQCERVIGPRPILFEFYSTFGNVCFAGANVVAFTFRSGCFATSAGGQNNVASLAGAGLLYDVANPLVTSFILNGFLIEEVSHSIQSQTMLISEKFNYLFLSLQSSSRTVGAVA